MIQGAKPKSPIYRTKPHHQHKNPVPGLPRAMLPARHSDGERDGDQEHPHGLTLRVSPRRPLLSQRLRCLSKDLV